MDARQIRAQISHPVIDSDGHWFEFEPLVEERLRKIGGDRVVELFSQWKRIKLFP